MTPLMRLCIISVAVLLTLILIVEFVHLPFPKIYSLMIVAVAPVICLSFMFRLLMHERIQLSKKLIEAEDENKRLREALKRGTLTGK